MKKIFDDYYLGLDIGTDSVGWAVTDLNYKLLKLNGKALWGVRLFESGNTAAERRVFRSARRRLERRENRIRLLQMLFAEEISKVDMGFYQRMKDSKYQIEDKTEYQINTLFHDLDFNDKDFHKKYPTIYHLRKELMTDSSPHDVRLVYLAIHHIMKHRGHFLFEGDNIDTTSSIKETLNRMFDFNVTDMDGTVAWVADNKESMQQIAAVMRKNNILFTRYAHEQKGGLFDQMPMKKGKGQICLKANMPIEKYGGYNKASGAYFILVEHTVKEERVRTLETVLLMHKNMFEKGEEEKEKYCKDILGLEDPKVLIDKIKIDTLFCVDGFYMHLSGRTGNQILFKGANQLCLSPETEKYIKKIVNYIVNVKTQKRDIKLSDRDEITKADNENLYDLLTDKIQNTIYKVRLAAQIKVLKEGRDKFTSLALEEQCKALYQIEDIK